MPNRKVLITEDNPGDFELFRNALKEAGYNIDLVQHKNNNQDFINLSDSELKEIHFALLDINISKYDAFDVCEKLYQNPHLPVYLFSSHAIQYLENVAVEIGAWGYFKKPDTLIEYKQIFENIENDRLYKLSILCLNK